MYGWEGEGVMQSQKNKKVLVKFIILEHNRKIFRRFEFLCFNYVCSTVFLTKRFETYNA